LLLLFFSLLFLCVYVSFLAAFVNLLPSLRVINNPNFEQEKKKIRYL
jgi:hypothetical protein